MSRATSSAESSVRGPKRVEPRAPERLVRVDVAEPRDDPLVEEHGLEWRFPPRELRNQPACREARAKRFGTVLGCEVRLELDTLEHEPGSEPAHVAVPEPSAVVELDDGALVRDRHEAEAPRHPQVDEQPEPALEPHEEVLPTPLDGDDAVSLELFGDLEQVVRACQSWVENLDSRECPALEARSELRSNRLDLGELGHRSYSTTSSRIPCACGTWSPIAYAD